MNWHRINCPICGEDNCELVLDRECWRGQVYLSICKNDGMVYLNPRWTDREYSKFYRSDYYATHHKGGSRVGIQQVCIVRSQMYFSSLRLDLSILDIGAGQGELFDACDIVVLQPRIKEAIEADLSYQKDLDGKGVTVISDEVDSDWHIGREKRYDFVVMRHVLEHFLNPEAVLKKVNIVLADDGVLYLAVPNLMIISSKRTVNSHFEPAHAYYFSARTLEALADRAGLQMLDFDSSSTELYGVFKKGKVSKSREIHSVYDKQLAVLKAFIK